MKFINKKWRTNNPKEEFSFGKTNNVSFTTTTDSTMFNDLLDGSDIYIPYDYTYYKLDYLYDYPYYWDYQSNCWILEQPNHQVLNWNGKIIMYRFLKNCIEYAIVKENESISFATADKLEEILILLRD